MTRNLKSRVARFKFFLPAFERLGQELVDAKHRRVIHAFGIGIGFVRIIIRGPDDFTRGGTHGCDLGFVCLAKVFVFIIFFIFVIFVFVFVVFVFVVIIYVAIVILHEHVFALTLRFLGVVADFGSGDDSQHVLDAFL